MGIYFCGFAGAVSEHGLDVADVDALLEQMGGKGMSEHVGRDFAVNSRFP